MAVKTILPVCNAYKRAQHPPIKAEVFQNVVFGQIQSRHIIGNRQILRRSFNHAPLNETSGRGPTRKLRTVSGKGPVSLRVFGCLPNAGVRGCTEAGVRKASREETAGRG
jgi:hypothetical protein